MNILIDSYIKNDRGKLRDLYFKLCTKHHLHCKFKPQDYYWTWLFEDGYGVIQQAPDRSYIRNKHELKLNDLLSLQCDQKS